MLLGGSAVQGLFYKGGRGRGETACMDTITQTKEQGTFWRPHVQATPILPDFVSWKIKFQLLSCLFGTSFQPPNYYLKAFSLFFLETSNNQNSNRPTELN